MNLRNWLKKTPRPHYVMADDKRIDVPNNHRAINDLLGIIQSLEPSKLVCFSKEDRIIRSVNLDTAEDEREPVAPQTPEQSDLQLFAKLLAEGYEHGRKANQPIVDQALQFVERQSVRLAKAEAEIERLRTYNHKLHTQILELQLVPVAEPPPIAAGGEDTILGSLVAGIVQGQLAGMAGATAPAVVTPITKTGAKKP